MLSKLLPWLRSALVCSLFLPTAASLGQTTINVGPGQPYATIQSGMNAAKNGDTVLVAPGTYTENINFNGKAITVTSSGGPTATLINGGNQAATVTFATNETRNSVLSNFTIVHGGDGTNLGTQGGISIRLASPTISGNTISGAGCYGIGSQAGSPLIQNNAIRLTKGNSLTNNCGDGNGSGIWLSGYSNPYGDYPFLLQQPPEILHNLIENNTYVVGSADTPGGAGISVRDGTTPFIAYNTIRSNTVQGSLSGGGDGGGIQIFAAGATIVNNLIYENAAISGGGGIAVHNFGLLSSPVSLINNTLHHNGTESVGVPPGGEELSISGSFPVTLLNNLLIGNSTRPAMVCFQLPPVSDPSAPLPISFASNDLYNGGGPLTGDPNGSNCNYPVSLNGNLATDPLFVNALMADFHLTLPSPAIDAGSNAALTGLALTTDLDGNPRIQDATGHGCVIDMGAYEYPGTKGLCSTTETLQSSSNPSTFGQTVTFTAQLSSASGVPTGDVQFSDGNTVLGTEAISAEGISTFTTPQLSVGAHTISAVYEPTGNFPTSTASLTQVVNGYPTTTALTSSINPANAGQNVTFTATATSQSGTPTGSLTFTDGGTTLAVVALLSGSASYSTSTLAVGSHGIAATFSPSANYAGSSATLTQTINGQPTSTSLSVTPNPATAFGTLTLASTVSTGSGTPSGSITFSANGAKLGTATLNAGGQGSLSVPAPLPATYSIIATYSGDTANDPSTSPPVSEVVLAAATTTALTASPNPAYQGQAVDLSATVTGVPGQPPTGLVVFYDGSALLGTGSLSATGAASLTASTLTAGTHSLTASYQAAGGYAGSSSSPVQETILPGTFGIQLSPSAITLNSGQQATVGIALTSIGGFRGPLTLSSGAMPGYASAIISPATVTLTAGGNGSANLVLNTATAQLDTPAVGGARTSAAVLAAFLVLLMPPRSRKRQRLRHVLGMLLLAVLLAGATGCGTIGFPFHTVAPGTYQVPVTATDQNRNSQSAILNVTVLP